MNTTSIHSHKHIYIYIYIERGLYELKHTFFQLIIGPCDQLIVRTNIEHINQHLSHLSEQSRESEMSFDLFALTSGAGRRLTFSPTKGNDQVKTSMKLGSQ